MYPTWLRSVRGAAGGDVSQQRLGGERWCAVEGVERDGSLRWRGRRPVAAGVAEMQRGCGWVSLASTLAAPTTTTGDDDATAARGQAQILRAHCRSCRKESASGAIDRRPHTSLPKLFVRVATPGWMRRRSAPRIWMRERRARLIARPHGLPGGTLLLMSRAHRSPCRQAAPSQGLKHRRVRQYVCSCDGADGGAPQRCGAGLHPITPPAAPMFSSSPPLRDDAQQNHLAGRAR